MATTKEISIGDTGARASEGEGELSGETMMINVGPSHPTTHGVLRLKMELDGDIIKQCEPVIGYLHRGAEKIAENMTYNQFVPYTDRLDYIAPLSNNVAYAMAVEKLANLEVPERCQAIRVFVLRVGARLFTFVGRGCVRYGCGSVDCVHVHLH
jgi:NADH-quinone oxidoreductase subunit D